MAKSIIGQVSSIAGDKTIVITTHWRKTHPIYKKQYTVSAKYMAHDEKNQSKVGDKVIIVESRPLSARKRYSLQEILKRDELTQEDRAIFEGNETSSEVEEVIESAKASKPAVKKPKPAKAGAEPKKESTK